MTPWEMITNLAVDTRSAPGDAAAAAPGGRMSGGRALAEMLRLHGVGPMFGMGGFQLLPFYEAVRELGLRHYLINDERAGAFAADAYARVSGRPGVCDGTLGPGATNLVTGLVESLNAGVPVIAIIGDTNRAHSWKHMTQEARQIEILRPAVKEMLSVEQPERIPELVRRAFAIATSGRGRWFSTSLKMLRTRRSNTRRTRFMLIRRRARFQRAAHVRTQATSIARWRCCAGRAVRSCWPAAASTYRAPPLRSPLLPERTRYPLPTR
jgi:hypothetical protein